MAVYTYVYTLILSMYQLAAAASGVATAPTVTAVIMHLSGHLHMLYISGITASYVRAYWRRHLRAATGAV